MTERFRLSGDAAPKWALIVVLCAGLFTSCASRYLLPPREGGTTNDGALVLPKGPYQMYVSPGEILIGAQLPDGREGALHYWPDGIDSNVTSLPLERAWDRIEYVRLSNLKTGILYRLRITVGDQSTPVYGFKAGVKIIEPFSFLLIGDTKPDCESIHPSLVELMSKRNASFYIHLGDFVRQGDRVSDWDLFFDIHRSLMTQMPIMPVVGNHDTSEAGLFAGLFLVKQRGLGLKRYFSVRFGNAQLIVLDVKVPIMPGDPQYRFLKAELEKSKTDATVEHIFLALHRPLYSSGKWGGQKSLRKILLPLIERYPVDIVFASHDHHFERSLPIKGIVHIVSGGGGAHLTKVDQEDFSARALQTFHFVEVVVDGPKLLLRVVNLKGMVVDEVQLK